MDMKQIKKHSWWDHSTKFEKVLFALTAFAVVVVICFASNLLITRSDALEQDVCLSETCISSAAEILGKIDTEIDPCTDFYKFACGNFMKNTIIPDGKVQISSSSDISEKIDLQMMKVFEEPIKEEDAKFLKLVKSDYKACMNSSQIEKEGLRYVKQALKVLGGWPVLEGSFWNEKHFDWKNTVYDMQKLGWIREMFISLFVNVDLKNPTRRILNIAQPIIAADKLKKGFNDTQVQALYKYLIDLSKGFGADEVSASAEMKEVIEFQIAFAKIIIPYNERKNITLNYNPIAIRDLQKKYQTIPWLQIINNYLSPIDMLTSDDVVNLRQPNFFDRLEDLVLNTPKRVLANYMFSRLLSGSIVYLPKEFQEKQNFYFKALYPLIKPTPRWKQCVSHADRFHIAVSAIFARKFVNKTIKNKVTELSLDIKSSFLDTLQKIDWIDQKTKKHAILKAEKINFLIAYPDEIFDDDKVEGYYEELELDPDALFFKQLFNYSRFLHMKHIKELRPPVFKPDWASRAFINYGTPIYIRGINSIDVSAAILQDHFFKSNRPQYMNYAAIGALIGKEITQGFDNRGRQFDKDGNLIDWWEPETNRTFARKSQCFVDQYGSYKVPEIEMFLNGESTLNSNIADNGGIRIAYTGYLKWLDRNKEELMLPGLPYTGKQLFWISAATNRCVKYKKEALKRMVLGFEVPAYFRTVIPFMNSDYFGKDFNCPLGSPMNPKNKCQVW